MESLAYLYLAQENESSKGKDLNLDELAHLSSKAMMVGALSFACTVGLSIAEKAEAYPCYGYSPASSYYGYSYYKYSPASYSSYSPYSNYYGYSPYYNYYNYSSYSPYYNYYNYSSYSPYYDYYNYYDYNSYYPVYNPTPYSSYSPYYDYYNYSSYTPYYNYSTYFRDWYAIYYPVSPADEAQAEAMVDQIYRDYVTGIQTKLSELGYYTVAIDGEYGESTANAVAIYQADQGLAVDGIVGPETGKSLGLGWSY